MPGIHREGATARCPAGCLTEMAGRKQGRAIELCVSATLPAADRVFAEGIVLNLAGGAT